MTFPAKVTKSADFSVLSENFSEEQQCSELVLQECVRSGTRLTFFARNCPNSCPDLSVIILLNTS